MSSEKVIALYTTSLRKSGSAERPAKHKNSARHISIVSKMDLRNHSDELTICCPTPRANYDTRDDDGPHRIDPPCDLGTGSIGKDTETVDKQICKDILASVVAVILGAGALAISMIFPPSRMTLYQHTSARSHR